jgi:1,2-phenylacetyl-CoA epoxidase catalytic subunit
MYEKDLANLLEQVVKEQNSHLKNFKVLIDAVTDLQEHNRRHYEIINRLFFIVSGLFFIQIVYIFF